MNSTTAAARRGAVLALLAVLALGIAACGSSSDSGSNANTSGGSSSGDAKGRTIKVGAIVPQTGPYAGAGGGALTGMQAAIKYLNNGGAVSGNKFELVTSDDQSDPTKAALAARKQIGDGITMGIPVGTPGSGAATQTVLQQSKVIFGGPNAIELDPRDMTATGKWPLSFQSGPSIVQFADAQIRYAAQTLKIKTVGQLYSADAVGKVFKGSAEAAAQKYGVKLVTESFQGTQKDVSGQLRSLQDKGAQALALWAYGTPLVTSAQSLGKLGWKVPVLTVLGSADPAVVSLLKRQAPDVLAETVAGPISTEFVTDTAGAPPKNKLAQAWAKYTQEVTGKPLNGNDLVGIYTFDAMIALDQAIKRANSTDTKKIADAMGSEPAIQLAQGKALWPTDRSGGVASESLGLFQSGSDVSSGSVLAPGAK